MGFWRSLFGFQMPGNVAMRVAGQADDDCQAHQLFEIALGQDPAHSGVSVRQTAAVNLVLANETVKGRQAWLAIARDYPDQLAQALEQLGICYHLEQDYRSALESYEAAIRVGANSPTLAENISEARKGLLAIG